MLSVTRPLSAVGSMIYALPVLEEVQDREAGGLAKMGRGSDSPRYPSEKLVLADGVYTLGKSVTFWSFTVRLSDVHHRTQSSRSFGGKMFHFYFDPLMSYLRSLVLIIASDLPMVK